jgi:putative membrane protein
MRSDPGGPARADPDPAPPRPGGGVPVVAGQRLHPVTPIFLLLRQARQLIPLLAAVVLLQWQAVALIPVVAVAAAITVLQWWRRTWSLDGRTLTLDEGVLARQHRVVPLERIQQVTIQRKPTHRLLGVATLRVETAGGGATSEISLHVVSLAQAHRLRDVLLEAKRAAAGGGGAAGEGGAPGGPAAAREPAAEPAAPPAERVLVRLSLREVVVAGLTGARGAAALAVLGPVLQYGDDLDLLDGLLRRIDPERVLHLGLMGTLLALLGAVLLWFALAAGSSVLTDFGFTMSLREGDVLVRRGLLERREAVVPLNRIQVVRLEESLLRRLLGRGAVRVQSAGSARRDEGTSRVAVPILGRARFDALLAELLPGAAPVPALSPHPPAARRRAVVRAVVPTALVGAALAALLRPWGGLALLTLALAVPLGLAAYRSLGNARSGEFLYARHGALIRSTAVVPARKAQSARVVSTPFQRRSGLATLYVDVAGSGSTPQVRDEREPTAEALHRAVLQRAPDRGVGGDAAGARV